MYKVAIILLMHKKVYTTVGVCMHAGTSHSRETAVRSTESGSA